MKILIEEDSWIAEITVSQQSNISDFVHCIGKVNGFTKEDAFIGAQYILDLFAKGRSAFIRVEPSAESDTSFDTKKITHRGFVRFSFRLESGDWQYSTDEVHIPRVINPTSSDHNASPTVDKAAL